MHAVRKHILEILKEHRCGATVAELAEQLEMAPVSVRHHLDILQGDNLICVDRLERKGNVGRPQQVYALTTEANSYFPNNFAGLAGKLVEQMKQVLPPEQALVAFRGIAREIAAEFAEAGCLCSAMQGLKGHVGAEGQIEIEEQLAQIAEFLNERGYLARWEADPDGAQGHYLMHKYNCPYAGVSTQHSELCLMDQTLVDELVGQPCQRTTSMVEGSHCCTYRILLSEEVAHNQRVNGQVVESQTIGSQIVDSSEYINNNYNNDVLELKSAR
ncbi:MAG: ArsR family transcriptional regulator [Caldilineaceae bacterium]